MPSVDGDVIPREPAARRQPEEAGQGKRAAEAQVHRSRPRRGRSGSSATGRGSSPFVLDGLAATLRPPGLGAPPRPDERADPHDPHPEQRGHERRARVRGARARPIPAAGPVEPHNPGAGWGGVGLPDGAAPDWAAVEFAPLPELTDVIRPGGLANQKAPRIQATLRKIREERGDYSLEFLGDMSALEARDWLTAIDGIGKKTASVLLLFCFGTPLLPIDRHVERVMRRVGLAAAEGHRSTRRTTSSSACSSPTRCTRPTST